MIVTADFGIWADSQPAKSFDHTIGDPPYLPRTQDNQRRGDRPGKVVAERKLKFGSLTAGHRELWAMQVERLTRRWSLIFSDVEGVDAWITDLERAGMRYMRTLAWIRGDLGTLEDGEGLLGSKGSPQFSGDRPAVGFECIVLAHAKRGAPRWNGGGKAGVYVHNIVEAAVRLHDAQKPLPLIRELVRDFTDKGERILDPWVGSGTLPLAARIEERESVGVELDGVMAAKAIRREEGYRQ